MSLINQGPLSGFDFPDYHGNSLLNLMASVIIARGGESPHPELQVLPASRVSSHKRLIYLVIDGLGREQLNRYLQGYANSPFFKHHSPYEITSLFPATTASVVTTFATGASPAEHAILSWYLHLHDLGVVANILPVTARTGVPLLDDKFDLGEYLQLPDRLASIPEKKILISYDFIPGSRFSRAGTRWDESYSHRSLREMKQHIVKFMRGRGKAMAYAYWPEYDGNCHAYGCSHPKSHLHLMEIDNILADLAAAAEQTDTVLIVTADHGLWDCAPEQRIDLATIPGFYDCLAMLPSGDCGFANLFVRPKYVSRFLDIVATHLGDRCVCMEGEALIETGAFGPGAHHPALANRVGDYVLLAREQSAFFSSLPQRPSHISIGNHGGMTSAEMQIPLFVVGG